jgi:hypothetical protein
MEDNRVRYETTKLVDLYLLDQQLGGYGLSGNDQCVVCVEGSPVTFAELKAAVDSFDSSLVVNAAARTNRHLAFIAEADPIYFAWQRGEATEEDWLAKCAGIRARYPYA